MSTDPERRVTRAKAWTAVIAVPATAAACLVGGAACLAGGYLLNRLGYISKPGEDNSGATKFPTTEPSPTPTPTPTPTETFTSTPTATPTPTETLLPTSTPRSLLYLSVPWTGELPLNNLIDVDGDNLMQPMMLGIANRTGDNDGSRLDSTLTSLTNEFSPKLFGVDPLTEPGFGLTSQDVGSYYDIKGLIATRGINTLSDMLTLNSKGIITMEIAGSEDDRDAALAVFATEQAFVSHKLNGFTGENTLQDVFESVDAVKTVSAIQTDMFKMIQEKGLGVSAEEVQQRKDDGGVGVIDASAGLPKALQGSDQSLSCDVYRTLADTRQDQLQATRQVVHQVEDGADTFTVANSGKEQTLWVWSYDPSTGKYKVGAFTARGYSGPVQGQKFSASGEQKLPCGPGVPEATATQENIPVPTKRPVPTFVPTNTHFPISTPTKGSRPTLEFTATTVRETPTPVPTKRPVPTFVPTNTHFPISTATKGSRPTLEPTATDIS